MTTLLVPSISMRLFAQRAHNQIMNGLNRDTMTMIRDTLMPFHFMNVAFTRYPGVFANRSERWRRIKRRAVHHERPNEFTGALRIAVLADSKITATATRGSFEAKAPADSMILSGPSAGKRIRRPLTEQRRKELEFVSEDEVRELAERQQQQYIAAAYDPANSERVLKQFR